MSFDAPESTQHTVSLLLWMTMLLAFAHVVAWDSEWIAVNRKRVEAVVLECARFIVASLVLPFNLLCLLITLVDVLASVKS